MHLQALGRHMGLGVGSPEHHRAEGHSREVAGPEVVGRREAAARACAGIPPVAEATAHRDRAVGCAAVAGSPAVAGNRAEEDTGLEVEVRHTAAVHKKEVVVHTERVVRKAIVRKQAAAGSPEAAEGPEAGPGADIETLGALLVNYVAGNMRIYSREGG